MKKLLSIIVLGLLLSGNAYAEYIDKARSKVKEWGVGTSSYREGYNKNSRPAVFRHSKVSLEDAKNKSLRECSRLYDDCIIYEITRFYGYSLSVKQKYFKDIIWKEEYEKYTKKIVKNKNSENEKKYQENIMFTIKDKREQCEAIGFEPKTEKFADCVLRLVELDVKSQQDNQIVSAESSGNEALVEELRKQRNLQSSRYLLDLGKQLRQPKQYNSNIYMPQTQRCTIQGFGSFAKMVCR
jgi:hypothetical protein